jgi:hypothetical protein
MTTPSHHHLHRLNHLTTRLAALIPIIDLLDRAAPVPPTIAGPMRRTLAEAARLLPAQPSPNPLRSPLDFLAATEAQMARLGRARRQAARAFEGGSRPTYPRGFALR